MKLKDTLTKSESAELRNIMNNEPVCPGDTISHYTAAALAKKGLISRNKKGHWVVNWQAIKDKIMTRYLVEVYKVEIPANGDVRDDIAESTEDWLAKIGRSQCFMFQSQGNTLAEVSDKLRKMGE